MSGYAGFKRNVGFAIGNWLASTDEPPEAAGELLRDALGDSAPLLSEDAAWALNRVGRRI